MMALIQYHIVTLMVALLIGFVTAYWAFPRGKEGSADRLNEDSTDQ